MDHPVWAGVLPLQLLALPPEPDEAGALRPELPGYLKDYSRQVG
jgi:hypothetical protein